MMWIGRSPVQLLNTFFYDFGHWTSNVGLGFLESGFPQFDRLLQDLADLRNLIDAHERIDFREEGRQLFTKPLWQTAGNNQRLAAITGLAYFVGFKNGIDTFFLRRVDERAGVYNHGISAGGIVRDFNAALEQ